MKVIRVAVIDDHAVVRMGLKYALSVFKDIQFAGEHPDGEGAAAFVEKTGPDIVLLDIRMPGKDGVAALIEELWFDGPRAEPTGKDLGSAWGNIESAGGSL